VSLIIYFVVLYFVVVVVVDVVVIVVYSFISYCIPNLLISLHYRLMGIRNAPEIKLDLVRLPGLGF